MRSYNLMAKVALAAVLVVGLSACGKKKNGSKNASTPGSTQTCSWNYQVGQYTYPNGSYCTPGGTGSTVCPQNGQYQNSQGQWVTCIPGQPVNPGYPHQPYPNNPQIQNCDYYTQYYRQQIPGWMGYYVPVYNQGSYVCVRNDLINPYTYNTPYYDDYDYYYDYPPYVDNSCSTQIDFGWGNGSVGVCF